MNKENKNEVIHIRIEPTVKEKMEVEELAKIIESTGGNGEVSDGNKKIIHLFATGEIDYETAVFAIKRNFVNKKD